MTKQITYVEICTETICMILQFRSVQKKITQLRNHTPKVLELPVTQNLIFSKK